MSARLDAIEARAAAATKGPWEVTGASARYGGLVSRAVDEHEWNLGYDGRLVAESLAQEDLEFIAAARQDVPDLVAALRAVLKPQITEPPEWLGEKRSRDIEGWAPGNAAYTEYMEAVLTAAYGDDIRWGPIFLAIILDRAVRAAEDVTAITTALDAS